MATSTLTDVIKDPGGNVVATSPGTQVNFRLMANGSPTPGFRISDGVNVASLIVTSASTTGTISQALENNKNITPGGTYYVAEILCPTSQGGTQEWALLSSSSVSPQTFLQAAAGPIPAFTPITTVPTSILGGNNTFTGINQFNGIVFFKSGYPWVDVRAYGAVGDGLTDDSTAIQNAVDALFAAGGGILYFPPGNYNLASSLFMTRATDGTYPVLFMGAGAGASQLTTSSAISMVHFDNSSVQTTRWGVTGLKFNLNHASAIGLLLTSASYGMCDNLEFAGVGTGIAISGAGNAIGNQFNNIRFLFTGRAISINTGNYNIFSNVVILEGTNGPDCVNIAGVGNEVNGFVCRANKLGSSAVVAGFVIAGEGTILSSGRVFDSAGIGIKVTGQPRDVQVRGVKVINCDQHGLYTDGLGGMFDVVLAGNSANNAGLYDNLYVANGADGNLFNLVSYGATHANDIEEQSSAVLSNTYIIPKTTTGLTLKGTHPVMLSGHGVISGTTSFGGGSNPIAVANSTTIPNANVGGGCIYASSGYLVWRGSGGTATEIAGP